MGKNGLAAIGHIVQRACSNMSSNKATEIWCAERTLSTRAQQIDENAAGGFFFNMPYQSNRLLEHFLAGMPARTVADLVDLNRRTAIHIYHRLRMIIARQIEDEWAFAGAIEVDESYVESRRKGKRGREAAGKVSGFGILQRGGKVYTQVFPDTKA